MDKDGQPETPLERIDALIDAVKKQKAYARAKGQSIVTGVEKAGGDVGKDLQAALDRLFDEAPADEKYDFAPPPKVDPEAPAGEAAALPAEDTAKG